MAVRTSDTQGNILNSDNAARHIGQWQDGSSGTVIAANAGSPTYRVDGAAFSLTTRDSIHSAFVDGDWHVVTVSAADLSAWSDVVLGFFQASNANNTEYDLAHISIYPDNTATRDLAEAAAADAIKETGYALAA
jgi:hypothetical protein